MNPPRPSGPGWEKYQKEERAHWQKHGKSSGKYHQQHGQRWKLDRKAEAGKPVRFSPKSVDVKTQESRKVNSRREQKIKGQTSLNTDLSKSNSKRTKINGAGKDHHHNAGVDRVDKGLGAKYGYPLPDKVHKTHNKVGVYFGDDRRNFLAADKAKHRQIHAEYDQLDAALKELDRSQRFKAGANAMRGFPGQSLEPSSGSQIVDRANGNMQSTGYASTLGVPLDLF